MTHKKKHNYIENFELKSIIMAKKFNLLYYEIMTKHNYDIQSQII